MRDISTREFKWWYENKTIAELMEHFQIKSPNTVYSLLEKMGIPLKEPKNQIRVVE